MTYEKECAILKEWFLEESARIDRDFPVSSGLDGPHAKATRELIRQMGVKGRALNKKYGITK